MEEGVEAGDTVRTIRKIIEPSQINGERARNDNCDANTWRNPVNIFVRCPRINQTPNCEGDASAASIAQACFGSDTSNMFPTEDDIQDLITGIMERSCL